MGVCEGATAGAGRQAEHAAPHTLQVIVLVERILRRLGGCAWRPDPCLRSADQSHTNPCSARPAASASSWLAPAGSSTAPPPSETQSRVYIKHHPFWTKI